MPRAEPEARVKKLEEAQARLNAELQRARGRLAQEKRKRETRRKILAGGDGARPGGARGGVGAALSG